MQITQIRNGLLSLFMVAFFFFPQLQTIIISACFVFVLLDKTFYGNFWRLISNNFSVALVLYFSLIALSMTYSSNLESGLRSIETKFSFLVFPFFLPSIFLNKEMTHRTMTLFWVGGMSYIFVSFVDALISFLHSHSLSSFFYSELGVGFFQEGSFIHPTYASFFYNILFAYLALQWIQNSPKGKFKFVIIASLIFVAVFIFMLSSKFGILALAINFLLLLWKYVKNTNQVLRATIFFMAFSIVSILVVWQSPLKKRFVSAYSAVTTANHHPSSTQTRLDVWRVTSTIISENPILGVGAGDIRNELLLKYQENDYQTYAQREYDSHQEFLQTYAALGLPGIIVLLFIFVLLWKRAISARNYLLFIFTTLFFVFGMVESMLERQAGVVFFVFFSLFLYSFNPITKRI